jgi:hypothetical protein
MLFDLTGAAASHAAVGDPAGKVAAPLIILGAVTASWVLRPEGRKLHDASGNSFELFKPTPREARLETGK